MKRRILLFCLLTLILALHNLKVFDVIQAPDLEMSGRLGFVLNVDHLKASDQERGFKVDVDWYGLKLLLAAKGINFLWVSLSSLIIQALFECGEDPCGFIAQQQVELIVCACFWLPWVLCYLNLFARPMAEFYLLQVVIKILRRILEQLLMISVNLKGPLFAFSPLRCLLNLFQ